MDRPLRPDWDGITQTIRFRLNLVRFENSCGTLKRERMEEIFDEEGPYLKKLKLTNDSGIPNNNLDEGWDGSLLERLQPQPQPANSVANQKPSKTTDNVLISLPQQHQFTTTGDSVEIEIHQKRRAQSQGPLLEAWARQARRRYLEEAVHLSVEHDDSEMPRTSPRNKKRASSPSQEEFVDLSNGTEQPLPGKEEGEESAGNSKSEAVVISAKRVKPDSGIKLQERSSTPNLASPTKTVSTGNAGTLRSGTQVDAGEEKDALEGNERDQKESTESQAAPKRKWSYFDRYKSLKPSNIRDYGNPRPVAPSVSLEQEPMAPVPSGPRPRNTLSGNPNPPFKKPEIRNQHSSSNHITHPNNYNLVGNRGSNQKQPQGKAYDLVADHNRSDGQPPSKRQKVAGAPSSHNGSSKSPIDVEEESTKSSRKIGPPASKSGYSQNMKGPQHNGVEEYQRVEDVVGFGKRKGSGSQSSIGHGGGSRFLRTASGQEIVRLDDPNDPVVDSEDEVAVTEVRNIKKTTSQSARLSNVEVQIPSSRQVKGTSSYQGSANKHPPRQEKKIWGNGDSRQLQQEETFSRHFPNTEKKPQGKPSAASHSDDGAAFIRSSAKSSAQKNGAQSVPKSFSRHSSPLPDPDLSVDELNAEEFHRERRTASALLAEQRIANAAAGKSKGKAARAQSIDLDESSDDDLANEKGHIQKTHFPSNKDTKSKTAAKDERYEAQLIFSEADMWLVDPRDGPWSLVHNPSLKTLDLFDRGNSYVWTLPTGKVEKIEFSSGSKILVIHKARDHTTGKGVHLYVTLRDSDQSNDLREGLKATQSTIQLIKKEVPHLDAVVGNTRAKLISFQESRLAAAKKKRQSVEEPEDVQLARANLQRRVEANRPSLKEATTPSAGRSDAKISKEDEAKEQPRSRGLARSMRTRSSSELFGDENLEVPEILTGNFYGKSTPRRENIGSWHETRSSTRGQDRDRKPRQLRPRDPTPPPRLSWTRENPNWTREWHKSIIYPAVGKDRATVDMGDVEKLDDGEYLNDNLIVFYLRYLQDQLEQQRPDLAKRIYFQNTFFYQKLAKPEKGSKFINYEAVKKWTSKVDLLSKDYIIIPINEHSHWYVAIICNAPKLLPGAEATDQSQSQDIDDTPAAESTNTDGVLIASWASLAVSKHVPESADGKDVDIMMKDIALDDKKQRDIDEFHSASNSMPEGQEVVDSDNPPPTNVTSDLLELEPVKANQAKKGKRKSNPPQRKYNPKEFRIITLDSLGSSHTTTCSNLKDYLVMEIKDKKNIDIPRPGSIGTTAKGIPLQNNYYDCGLFLLSYVEMFLQSPDEFVSGILQNDIDKEYHMPQALEKRGQIRDLLFDLQKEQLAEAELLAKLKVKGKKSGKTEDKPGSASTYKLSSQETSKSARESPDGQASDEPGDAQDKITRPELAKEEPSKSRPSALSEPVMRVAPENSGCASRAASPVATDVPRPDKPSQSNVNGLDAVGRECTQGSHNMINRIVSGTTNFLNGFRRHEKSAGYNAPTLNPNVIDINESPLKGSRPRYSGIEDSSRTFVEDEYPSLGRTEHERVPKTMRQHDAQSSRQSRTRQNGRDLISPTPDTVKHLDRTPAGHEVHDLRSPSPETVEGEHGGSTKTHHTISSVLEETDRSISEDRQRAVRAPSPEIQETLILRKSRSRESRYTVNGGFEKTEIGDSEEDDPVDFVKTDPRPNGVSKTAAEFMASDAEMLMQPGDSQEEEIEDADPEYLSSSPAPPPRSVQASKAYREGIRSVPTSPVSKHKGIGRTSPSSEYRVTKRKSPGTGESDDWQNHRRVSPSLRRDASDQAVIGKHLPRGSGKHTRFSP